jgi:hypothetical protein
MAARVVLFGFAAAVIGATVARAEAGVRVVGNCAGSQVRPSTIIVACADAGIQLTHLRWSSFGGSRVHATGDYTYNDCKPDCAAGHFHSYPVRVVLSHPMRCPDGHRDYRIATATYNTTRRPPGSLGRAGKAGRLVLLCPLS